MERRYCALFKFFLVVLVFLMVLLVFLGFGLKLWQKYFGIWGVSIYTNLGRIFIKTVQARAISGKHGAI